MDAFLLPRVVAYCFGSTMKDINENILKTVGLNLAKDSFHVFCAYAEGNGRGRGFNPFEVHDYLGDQS